MPPTIQATCNRQTQIPPTPIPLGTPPGVPPPGALRGHLQGTRGSSSQIIPPGGYWRIPWDLRRRLLVDPQGDLLGDPLRVSLGDALVDPLDDPLGCLGCPPGEDSLKDSFEDPVVDLLGTPPGDHLRDSVGGSLMGIPGRILWGTSAGDFWGGSPGGITWGIRGGLLEGLLQGDGSQMGIPWGGSPRALCGIPWRDSLWSWGIPSGVLPSYPPTCPAHT